MKTIDVNVKEWFDKVNGNSYFAGEIVLDYGTKEEKTLTMPFQYGYGDFYLQEASAVLEKENLIQNNSYTSLTRYCRENEIILRNSKIENCKQRELKAYK